MARGSSEISGSGRWPSGSSKPITAMSKTAKAARLTNIQCQPRMVVAIRLPIEGEALSSAPDDGRLNAMPNELRRREQSGWTGPDDQNGGGRFGVTNSTERKRHEGSLSLKL